MTGQPDPSPAPRQLTNREERDLKDLNWSWEGAYTITFDELRGLFRARHCGPDPGDDVTDTSVTSLRDKIRHDYQYRDGGLPRGE